MARSTTKKYSRVKPGPNFPALLKAVEAELLLKIQLGDVVRRDITFDFTRQDKKTGESYIIRTQNAYVIFKNDLSSILRPLQKKFNNAIIMLSKRANYNDRASIIWDHRSERLRVQYQQAAAAEKIVHQLLYPGYTFHHRNKRQPKTSPSEGELGSGVPPSRSVSVSSSSPNGFFDNPPPVSSYESSVLLTPTGDFSESDSFTTNVIFDLDLPNESRVAIDNGDDNRSLPNDTNDIVELAVSDESMSETDGIIASISNGILDMDGWAMSNSYASMTTDFHSSLELSNTTSIAYSKMEYYDAFLNDLGASFQLGEPYKELYSML